MNKVAVITGGAKGIGRSIAQKFSMEGYGVVIIDNDRVSGVELEEELHRISPAMFIQADITNTTELANARLEIVEAFGRIDCLVINAGISKKQTIAEISMEEWTRVIDVNLTGTFYTLKLFYEDLKTSQGKLLFITSGSAITGTGGGAHYAASKAGQHGLMRAAAKELGPFGVNVNAIAPRVIESDLFSKLYPDSKAREQLLTQIPIGRFGQPEDIASLCYFLASEESSYIHGQIIMVDGGRTY